MIKSKVLILSLIPAIVLALAVLLKWAAGPFWLNSTDHSYSALTNILYLVDHQIPPIIEHPGFTLYILGAIILKLFHWNINAHQIPSLVFQNPEYYLSIIGFVLTALNVVSLVLLGNYAYRKAKDLVFAIILQSTAVMMIYLFPEPFTRVSTDALLLPIGNMFILGILCIYFSNNPRGILLGALLCGNMGALAIATKFNSFPWVVLPLLLLPGLRSKFVYISALMGTWLLIVVPVWGSNLPQLGAILFGLIFKTGVFGGGKSGIVDPVRYFNQMIDLFKSNFLIVLISFGSLLASVRQSRINLFLKVLALGILIIFIIVAKIPIFHYMLPAYLLLGVIAALLYERLKNQVAPVFFRIGIGLFISLFLVINLQVLFSNAQTTKQQIDFVKSIDEKYKDYTIACYYGAPSQACGLAIWSDGVGSRHFSSLLGSIYPATYFLSSRGEFQDLENELVSLEQMARNKKGVVIVGGPEWNFSGLQLEKVQDLSPIPSLNVVVHRVHSYKSPRIPAYMNASQLFSEDGKYELALFFALLANKLGMTEDVTDYILWLMQMVKNKNNPNAS